MLNIEEKMEYVNYLYVYITILFAVIINVHRYVENLVKKYCNISKKRVV